MIDFQIYLAGKTGGLTQVEANGWRNNVKNILENYESKRFNNIRVINPNDFFNYYKTLHKTHKQIKRFFMSQIDKSDLVIVNLNNSNSSVGTGQELEHARVKGIPIIGYGTENIYPWESEEDCDVVFNTEEECVEYVLDYYLR